MYLLGVDPGVTGAAAILRWPASEVEEVRSFEGQSELMLRAILADLCNWWKPARAVVEVSPPLPFMNRKSIATVARQVGLIIATLDAAHVATAEVGPKVWQRWYRETGQLPEGYGDYDYKVHKARKLRLAQKLFGADHATDSGPGDALLIARFGAEIHETEFK